MARKLHRYFGEGETTEPEHEEWVDVPDEPPTADERLAAIEKAISEASDFAGMRSKLAADKTSGVEVKPTRAAK